MIRGLSSRPRGKLLVILKFERNPLCGCETSRRFWGKATSTLVWLCICVFTISESLKRYDEPIQPRLFDLTYDHPDVTQALVDRPEEDKNAYHRYHYLQNHKPSLNRDPLYAIARNRRFCTNFVEHQKKYVPIPLFPEKYVQ